MSIDLISVVNQRLKPVERKIRQILRIGQVTDVTESKLKIAFSDVETVENVPFLAINGLQISPKKEDSVLVYAPQGRLEHSVALAVVSMGHAENEHDVTLTGKQRTLGNILKELADAIREISTPGFFNVSGKVDTTGPKGTWTLMMDKIQPKETKTIETKGFK